MRKTLSEGCRGCIVIVWRPPRFNAVYCASNGRRISALRQFCFSCFTARVPHRIGPLAQLILGVTLGAVEVLGDDAAFEDWPA